MEIIDIKRIEIDSIYDWGGFSYRKGPIAPCITTR